MVFVIFVVMFSTSDTIVAIATPPGRGGIGVVRLSGPDAHAIARRLIDHPRPLEPRHATLTIVRLPALRSAEGKEMVASPPPLAFVCEDDVRLAIEQGRKLVLAERAIVTPSARDLGEAHQVFSIASY